jgi:hypothetical protein
VEGAAGRPSRRAHRRVRSRAGDRTRRSALARRHAAPRHSRLRQGPARRLGAGTRGRRRTAGGAAAARALLLSRRRDQCLWSADRGRRGGRERQYPEGRGGDRHRDGPAARPRVGLLRSAEGRAAPSGAPAAHGRPAGGSELRGARARSALAEVASSLRAQPARGTGGLRRRLRGRRPGALDPAPRLALGDDRSLRGPGLRVGVAERVRRGGVRARPPRQQPPSGPRGAGERDAA